MEEATKIVPLPSSDLRERVGVAKSDFSPEEAYLAQGLSLRRALEKSLPVDWVWEGKRVLDFGCGAGRVLRHFQTESTVTEFWGCDIDAPSIDWCRRTLTPPMTFRNNLEVPPLDAPTDYFDLVYGLSVFTHISSHWAHWLLELHRITLPGGIVMLTFMGEGMSMILRGEPWNDETVGMNVYFEGLSWSQGGPMVLHSPWWIREHWGRLFSIERLEDSYFGSGEPGVGQDNHGIVLLRKTDRTVSYEDLIRINPDERRETSALYHEVQHLRKEVASLRSQCHESAY